MEAGTATDTSGTQQTTSVVGTAPAPASDTPVSSAVLQSSETEVVSGQDTVLGNYLTSSTGVATGSADNTQGNTLSATASGTGDGAAQETSSTDQGIDTLSQNPSPATDTPVSTALLLSSEVEVASGQDEVAGTYLTSSTSTAASFADSAQSNAMSTGAAGVETSASTVSQSAQGVALPVSTEAATAADVPASTQVAVVVGGGAGVALDTTTSSATMYASDSEAGVAGDSTTTQLTHLAVAVEAAFSADIGGVTAIFIVGHSAQAFGQEVVDGVTAQFSSISEVVAALEALIVEAFGPSKRTPELTRVLLQVATTSVLMRADRIEVLREELRTVVETGVEKDRSFVGHG